jgi:hypothetical protein
VFSLTTNKSFLFVTIKINNSNNGYILFATLCNQISQTQKQKAYNVEVHMVLATNNAVVKVYKRMMAEVETTIATLKARLECEEQKKDDSGSN